MPAYEGETAVGRRVEIEWPEEEEGEPPPWYGGLVKQYDEEQGYLVLYDDGDEAVSGGQSSVCELCYLILIMVCSGRR